MELATTGPELGSLLAEADDVYKLPSRVKRDIHFLRGELESLQAALGKIAEVPADELDEQTKARAAELRDLAFRIQHAVSKLRGRILTHRSRMEDLQGLKGFAARINFKLGSVRARHDFATSIRELKILVKESAERYERYKIDSFLDPRHAITEDDGLQSLPDAEDLVGIDGHREKLIKIITEEGATSSQQLKVVAIVGDGPVGKTTLAKVVYDSIKQQFQLAAWVTVSSRPDIIKILRSMLRQISQEEQHDYSEVMDPEQLIDKIRRTLQKKRYLIVVDNILDEPEWELLKCALIDNNYGSAVLMTSRKHGHIAHFVGTVYELPPLSELDSKKLFYQLLLGSEDKCPSELAGIFNFVLKKCGGMPSTIMTISKLLEDKTSMTKDELSSFCTSVYNGLLFGQTMGHGLEKSQHDLPPHLKPCLLYLSMFGKCSKINAEHLKWQWLAEGFIHQETESEGRTLQELGEQYLNELINRKLIEPIDVDADGRVLYCSVNETEHEFIIALSKQENFVTVLDSRKGRSMSSIVNRLSIQGSNVEHPLLEQSLSQVKSLVISGDSTLMPALSALPDLRVLDLGGCSSLQNDGIKDIGHLFYLKCLIIGGKCITRIPEKIGSLVFLETMDLRESGVIELPERIVQVKQLKRLYVNSFTKIPHGIGKLEALQELGDINVSEPELLQELCNLTKLRVLRIAIWSWDESLKSYDGPLLDNLCSLVQARQTIQSLSILTCCSLDFLAKLDTNWAPPSLKSLEIRYGAFNELPIWIESLQYLSSLSIEVNDLSQDIIHILGKLPKLCSLSLTSKHVAQGKFGIKTDEFKQLTSLSLVSNAMKKVFTPEPEAMQMLKRVKLSFQASRTEAVNECFSFGLEDLCSLEHVHVEINCFNASPQVVEDSETAIRVAISSHSRHPNLVIRRVREKDMVRSEEKVVLHNTKQKEQPEMKNKKSSSRKIKITAKRFRQKEKGVVRKYKIVSLQLNSHILTLEAL